MVNTALITRQVTKGKKNWKFPLLMNISPGSFPKNGVWCQKVKSKPKRIRKTPPKIKSLPKPSITDFTYKSTCLTSIVGSVGGEPSTFCTTSLTILGLGASQSQMSKCPWQKALPILSSDILSKCPWQKTVEYPHHWSESPKPLPSGMKIRDCITPVFFYCKPKPNLWER